MSHIPVLLDEVIEFFDPKPGEDFVDATFGGGGHAKIILEHTAPDGRLIGIDASSAAIKTAKKTFANFGDRIILIHNNFRNLKNILYDHAIPHPSGILLDLGFSSIELADATLGISFQIDGPLDMRYSSEGVTAAEIVNTWPEKELTEIIRKFGEERYGAQIARGIVKARKQKRLITTTQLVQVILAAVPKQYRQGRIHPATRTFQALRIAVNDELGALEAVLPQAVDALASGGRLAVIAFHSLEDRRVKRFFRERAGKELRILTKKPIQAGKEEIGKNPRARSAKLRVAQKL